jgi:hypothetical protein
MKKQYRLATAILVAAAGTSIHTVADTLASSMGMYVYPAKGQTAEQQSKDDYECFSWAKGQTGYDPMNPPQATAAAPAQQGPSGERLRGAARGAAGGAIIGEIADEDVGDAAAVGATLGAMRGGATDRRNRREDAQQAQQTAQQTSSSQETAFKNAYGACIESRGYSVKF